MTDTYQLDACSVFCGIADFSAAQNAFERHGAETSSVQPAGSFPTLLGRCGNHDIKMASMPWEGPGKELAKTILGALTYVRRIATTHAEAKQRLLADLAACRLLIGLTGSHSFLCDSRCQGLVRDVATSTHGVIFDGADFYDSSGLLLLSHDGRSDIL